MKYEIKVRLNENNAPTFEVWFSGVRVRAYKHRSGAQAFIDSREGEA